MSHWFWCGHCKCYWYSDHAELMCPLCKQGDRFVGVLDWSFDHAWAGDPFPLAEFLVSV